MVTFWILLPHLVFLAAVLLLAVLFSSLLGRLPWSRQWPLWRRRATSLILAVLAALVATASALQLVPDQWVRATPRGDLKTANLFVAFGLGLCRTPDGGEPAGESNRAIARWLIEHNPHRKPAIVQQGVYLALKEFEAARPGLAVDTWVLRLPHDPELYVDTRGAALQTWALMTIRGRSRPTLVAHDLQLQRMVWTFEELRIGEDIIIPDLPSMPFDPASVQHWGTRSRPGWLVWELFFARPISLRPGAVVLEGLVVLAAGLLWFRCRSENDRSLSSLRPLH
jgi:hypothetical protein